MLELKQHHHWRWASLAAIVILLALGLIVVGSYVVAAQGPSSPASAEVEEYDLRVGKWNFPGNAQPGGVFVYGISYGNIHATGTAYDVEITDTLPDGTTYLGDTSGFEADYNDVEGTVTWTVGTLGPGDSAVFAVTLGIPPDTIAPGVIDPNQAAIETIADDLDPSNNQASSEPVAIIPPVEVDLDVGKGPEPGDPTPGEEFQYSVNWCNHSGVAVGPVTLIDTLPADVYYVDWYPAQPWQNFWNLVSADDTQVVLEAPGVPGNDWCQQLYIVLRLDESVPISTTLENTIEIHVDGDEHPENDVHVNTDAHVSPPRADMFVEKWFNGGILAPDGQIEYGGRYWNVGNIPVNATLVDRLPEGLEYVPGSTWMNGQPFDNPTIVGQELTWDLGPVPVNQGADFSFLANIVVGDPSDEFGNCIEINHDQEDGTPWDNESCVTVQIFESGPNLHVEKRSQWNGDNIYYWFFAANLGDLAVDNIIIVDSYPEGTEPMGEPSVPEHLREKTVVSAPLGQLRFEIENLQPGEGGWFDFTVGGIDPEIKPAEFHNIIEISGDLDPGEDVNEADNSDDDLIVIPAIDRVELFLTTEGQSSMWGEAIAGQVVTVTTESGVFSTTVGMPECPTCWEIQDTGMVNEGEEIEVKVKIGEGEEWPVTFGVPFPFTAVLDSAAGTVSGQIGGWELQPVEVHGEWQGGFKQLMTNELGEYEAVYADPIPPGAQGAAYFETMVNYTQVTYRRHFYAPWMRVNYAHDWVGGNYPLGHTFVITVTESDEVTEKGIAEVEVTSDGGGGGSGFSTQEDSWVGGNPPDIVPGDFVIFSAEDGYRNTVQVGDIGGVLDLAADSIGGSILAPFGSEILQVRCEIQAEDAPEGKDSEASADGVDPYYCDWATQYDIQRGDDVAVMYTEPDDGDRVINVFRVPAPDMSVGKGSMGGDQFAPGGFAVFQISYHNDGDGVAYAATLRDTLPLGMTYVEDTSGIEPDYDEVEGTVTWDLGEVPDGEGGQFQLLVWIPPDLNPVPETLTNAVEIFDDDDRNEENNYAEATIRLADPPSVELYVNKSPMPGDPAPGSTYIYEIEYGNSGSVATGEATLTDIIPDVPGVCSTTMVDWYSQNGYDLWTDESADDTELVLVATTLPAQWGDRIILRLRVDEACPIEEPPIQLVNLVTLESPEGYAEHENGDAQVHEPYVNVHLDKGFGWGVLVPGGDIGYNLHVANHGNMTATVTLTDTLPVGASYLESGSWDGQEYEQLDPVLGAGTVTWDLGELPPGSWLNVDLHLAIDSGLEANDVLTNCAELAVVEEDVWPYDNAACRTDAVRAEGPNLRIYKEYRWNWEGQLHYEIAFQNVGTELLGGVEIVDTLPADTSFHGEWGPAFWQGFDIIEGPGTLSWNLPDLEPGSSGGLWFNVDLDVVEQGDSYTNLAEADVPGDVWTEDNVSEVTAYTGPDIYITKWLSDGEVRPGEIVTFTVEFGNKNKWPWSTDQEDPPDPATIISDDLPDELTFIEATYPYDPESVWEPAEYDETTNTVTWYFDPMHPESWWTFQIVVQVAEDAEMGAVIVNTVEAYSNSDDDTDPLPGNNTFDLELTIGPNYVIYLPLISRNY